MKTFLLLLLFALPLNAGSLRSVPGEKWEQSDAAAVNINFQKVDQALGNMVTKTGTQTITGTKTFGTVTITSGTVTTLNSTTGNITTINATTVNATNLVGTYPSGYKNRIINGTFAINQRVATSATDDVYHVDRWYALTQTSSVTIAVQTLSEDGQPTNLRIGQPGTAQRIGLAQIIEDDNSQDLRGTPVTLSARIRCSSSQAIRYAILESTQTPDTVTSDVVNDWTSGTYTVGNFFIAGLVVAGTGSTTPSANTWTDISLTATLSSDVDNIIVFFWTSGTLAQTATLDVGKVQLEAGSTASAFERRAFTTELSLCQRYYDKSYALATAPGTATTTGALSYIFSTADWEFPVFFKVSMRAAPTITFYNPNSGAAGSWRASAPADRNMTTVTIGEWGFSWQNTNSVTIGNRLQGHWTASIEL